LSICRHSLDPLTTLGRNRAAAGVGRPNALNMLRTVFATAGGTFQCFHIGIQPSAIGDDSIDHLCLNRIFWQQLRSLVLGDSMHAMSEQQPLRAFWRSKRVEQSSIREGSLEDSHSPKTN
jgi:hypothetical protein